MKAQVTAITLHRLEGPKAECGIITIDEKYTASHFLTASTDPAYHGNPKEDRWTWAHELLTRWGHSAPMPHRGYDKTDATVEWNNGHHWRMRFDLQQHGRDSSGHNLKQALRHALTVYSGRHQPTHMTKEQYRHFIREIVGDRNMDRARDILDTCDL